MPQRDRIHNQVRNALIADGWTITDEEYHLKLDTRSVYIDIFAERSLLAAERAGRRIAVEVKSFLDASEVKDLRDAVGQYILYAAVLRRIPEESDRLPYLAVDSAAGYGILDEAIGRAVLEDQQVRVIVVDIQQERIVEWRPRTTPQS